MAVLTSSARKGRLFLARVRSLSLCLTALTCPLPTLFNLSGMAFHDARRHGQRTKKCLTWSPVISCAAV